MLIIDWQVFMALIHKKDYYLRFSDFDCRDELRPSSILDLFQDAASEHGEQMGVGFESMFSKQMLWVILRIKYKMYGKASMFDAVTVTTQPMPSGKAVFLRDYFINDKNGGLIAKGTSQWVVIHSEKRRLLPVSNLLPPIDPESVTPAFSEKIKKLSDFEKTAEFHTVIPAFSSLDHNGHVNNIRYAEFVMDAARFTKDEKIDTFQIDFLHEVYEGEELKIYISRENGKLLAKAVSQEEITKFLCEITFKR